MSGIMDMFRGMMGGQPGQQPVNPNLNPNAQNPNAQPPAQRLDAQQTPANVGADPANPNFGQPAEPADKSPLEGFKDLWTIDPKNAGTTPSLGDFAFNVDQGKINQAVKNIDFTKVITPEIMGKIKEGGNDAMAAMLTAMNAMAQESVKNSILVSAGIVEGGIKSSGANTEKLLPSLVRKSNISNALREDNPLFSNPATAPMLTMLEGQLTRKFPNATPAEIAEHARKYLVEFTEAAKGLDPEAQKQAQDKSGAKVPVISDFSTWE